jgi:preprotein translocase subunit YajC
LAGLEPILLGVIVVVIIIFMIRNGRKRAKDAATLSDTLKPGAEIMTSSGIFGTIVSIDEAENKIVLKTGPTSEITIHRQAVGRVVTPPATTDIDDNAPVDSVTHGITLNGESLGDTTEPKYGERANPGSDTK